MRAREPIDGSRKESRPVAMFAQIPPPQTTARLIAADGRLLAVAPIRRSADALPRWVRWADRFFALETRLVCDRAEYAEVQAGGAPAYLAEVASLALDVEPTR